MIEAGVYKSKPLDWGVGETKDGNPKVVVFFLVTDKDGQSHKLKWEGYFSGKAKAIALKALINCGLKDNDLDGMAVGLSGGALDPDREVELSVITETTSKGTSYAKINWVNQPSGSRFQSLSPQIAKSKFAGLNLKADIMAMRQGLSADLPDKAIFPPKIKDDEDLPF